MHTTAHRTLGQIGYETMARRKGSNTAVMAPIPPALSETDYGRTEQAKWEEVAAEITNALRTGKM